MKLCSYIVIAIIEFVEFAGTEFYELMSFLDVLL